MNNAGNVFLCSFCGARIKTNKNNLIRHEKSHKSLVIKIKCAHKKCSSTFQQKSDYYKHWSRQHQHFERPATLTYIEEEKKAYRRKLKDDNEKIDESESRPNDFLILNYLGLVENNGKDIKLPLPQHGTYFGRLD